MLKGDNPTTPNYIALNKLIHYILFGLLLEEILKLVCYSGFKQEMSHGQNRSKIDVDGFSFH
jgi:hypothetical protein